MSSATETTAIPVASTLAQFNKHGLPGLVIWVLFAFLAVLGFYGVRALINNTAAMVEMTATLRELKEEIKECREASR